RFGPSIQLAIAVGVENERRPALRIGRIAGAQELAGIEPTDHLLTAAGPERVAVDAELQMMSREAGIDEDIFAIAWIVDRELATGARKRKAVRRWMARPGLTEGRVIGRADARRVPHPALRTEHRIVRDGARVPDALASPVGRG